MLITFNEVFGPIFLSLVIAFVSLVRGFDVMMRILLRASYVLKLIEVIDWPLLLDLSESYQPVFLMIKMRCFM